MVAVVIANYDVVRYASSFPNRRIGDLNEKQNPIHFSNNNSNWKIHKF